MKETGRSGTISYILLCVIVIIAALFSVKDCLFILQGGFREGFWEYLILFFVVDILFIICALLYLIKKKWKPLLYTVALALLLHYPFDFYMNMPIALFAISIIELVVLVIFRKQFIY